jgi:hypothetical protein
MIELFSEKTVHETLAQLRGQGLSERETREELKHIEKHLFEGDLKTIEEFQLFSVVSADAIHYEEIEFLVTSRFKRDGDIFLAGEQFCVNISKLLRETRAALDYWRNDG